VDYFKKIEESIKFSWRYKGLWVFGFLLGLFGGGSNSSTNYNYSFDSENEDVSSAMDSISEAFEDPAVLAIMGVLICVGLIVGLVVWYIASVSKGALINAVKVEKQGGTPTFKDGWEFGKTKAFGLIKLDLIALAFMLVMLVVLIPIILISIVFPLFWCAVCLLIPFLIVLGVAWVIAFTGAQRYLVLKNMGARTSLRAGWRLAKKKILEYVIAWLVSIIPGCAWSMILAPLGILSTVVMMVVVVGVLASSPLAGVILLGIIGLTFALLVAVINSPFVVFSDTYWTKIIMEMMDEEEKQG